MPVQIITTCDICKEEFRSTLEQGRRGCWPKDTSLVLDFMDDREAITADETCDQCRKSIRAAVNKCISQIRRNSPTAKKPKR